MAGPLERRKKLRSLALMVLFGLGFASICVGSYLVSLDVSNHPRLRVIVAYTLIVGGFLALMAVILWTVCHGMRSNVYRRGRQRDICHLYVCTIDSPSLYPPAYEESQQHQASTSILVVTQDGLTMALAPPLYTQHSSETPDYSFSWELPPPYSQAVLKSLSDPQEPGEAA
ncbi:transmembrane protein 252-like [Aplochiton taeniatus]